MKKERKEYTENKSRREMECHLVLMSCLQTPLGEIRVNWPTHGNSFFLSLFNPLFLFLCGQHTWEWLTRYTHCCLSSFLSLWVLHFLSAYLSTLWAQRLTSQSYPCGLLSALSDCLTAVKKRINSLKLCLQPLEAAAFTAPHNTKVLNGTNRVQVRYL